MSGATGVDATHVGRLVRLAMAAPDPARVARGLAAMASVWIDPLSPTYAAAADATRRELADRAIRRRQEQFRAEVRAFEQITERRIRC